MRRYGARLDHRRVPETPEVSLMLKASVDPQGSISGSIAGEEDAEPRRFSGWLGLAAQITELLDRTRATDSPLTRPPSQLPNPTSDGPSQPDERWKETQ